MVKSLWSKFKLFVGKDPKKTLLFFICSCLLFGLLWESGSEWFTDSSSRSRQIASIYTFGVSFAVFLLYFDYGRFLNALKSRKFYLPSGEFFVYVLCSILCLVSFLCNSKKSVNANTYLALFLTFSSVYFVIRTFGFDKFASFFIKTMVVVCLVCLPFYFLFVFSGFDFSTSIIQRNSTRFFSNFYSLFYWLNRDDASIVRLQGPFWEPGVFATFLALALLLYFWFAKKIRPFIPILFLLCIVLTFSTAGYVISLIIFLFAYCKRHRTIFSRILPFIFLALVAGSIIFWKPLASFLSQLAPTLFGKLDSNNASFTTRIYSWLYGLKVFITNPLFGYGGQTARDLYFDLIQKDGISIDAFTSTFGYLAASFGILGILIYLLPIFGLIFAKDCSWPSKFFLFVIYIFVSNQENQATLYFAQIIYFYFALYGKRVFKFFNDQKPAENEDSKKRLLDIFLRKDHSGVVASNVAAIGVLKVASILLGIITIPTYLAFFGEDNTSYGAWLTIISVLNWILTFDFGFGNSLRNKLSEALSKRQMPLVKSYISSAYVISGILSLIWIVGLSIAIPLLDLNTVLGISTSIISSSALKLTIFLLFIGIALELTLKNIMYILDVMGKNAISSSLPFISNLLLLLAAVIVHAEGDQRFVVLAAIYCGAVLLPYFVPTFYIFIKKKMPSPSVRSLSKVAAKGIFSMGIGFFIVQCSNLFLGSLNELLITKIMGNPAYVLEYTEYYKIFGAFWSLGTVIQSTIWVSISKADALQNLSSIKKDIKFSLFFFSGIFLLCIVAGVSLPLIFPIWLGNDSPGVNWIYVLVFILYSFVYVAAEFVILICNGFGLVKQQAIIAGVAMVLKIPLCLLLSLLFKDQLRWSIVILANAILLLPYLPVCWILIKKRLRGMEAAKNAKIQESKKTD